MSTPDIPIITLNEDNLAEEHICCGFSDKKHIPGTELKKEIIKTRLPDGYKFKKYDIRGKAFIEYVPGEHAWAPVSAKRYMFVHCFWVSGRYKGQGWSTNLLQQVEKEAASKNMYGVVVLTTKPKKTFLVEKKYYLHHGYAVCDTAAPFYELMVKKFRTNAPKPAFNECARKGEIDNTNGVTVFYTHLCPFSKFYINEIEMKMRELNIPLNLIEVTTKEQAQDMPGAHWVFNIFVNGKHISHELNTADRFAKLVQKHL